MAERYQDNLMHGIGVNLYAAINLDFLKVNDMDPEALMNSVWEIVEE